MPYVQSFFKFQHAHTIDDKYLFRDDVLICILYAVKRVKECVYYNLNSAAISLCAYK